MSYEAEASRDPILAVSGVSAGDILQRIENIRANPEIRATLRQKFVPSLSDLMRLGDAEFVEAAHIAVLRRLPFRQETERRLEQLGRGKSRFEIVARMMVSQEGRNSRADVRGPMLRAIAMTARIADRAVQLPWLRSFLLRISALDKNWNRLK